MKIQFSLTFIPQKLGLACSKILELRKTGEWREQPIEKMRLSNIKLTQLLYDLEICDFTHLYIKINFIIQYLNNIAHEIGVLGFWGFGFLERS